MGGSGGGGGGYFKSEPAKLKKKLQDSEDVTQNAEYEAKVADLLTSLLSEFNDRDYDAINFHLDEIRKALEKKIEGTIDVLFGGSVAKHTYIDGLSDIDSLVIIDDCELANKSPEKVKEYFAKQIRERFPKAEVEVGTLAVTVRFSDAEIQLLPAISCKKNIEIPDKSGKKWAEIKPKEFVNVLSHANEHAGKKVVPVVKLAKAIIANLPDPHHISGYHAESLAVEIFKNYKDELKPKTMLKHYFKEASSRILDPIKDHTGQSVHVDDYLGASNSLKRRIIADAFGRVYRRINNSDNAGSLDEWHTLFGV